MPDRPVGPSGPFEVAMAPGAQKFGYFKEVDTQCFPSKSAVQRLMPVHSTSSSVVPAAALRRGAKDASQSGNKHFCLVILTKEQATDIYQMRSTTHCTDPASLAVAGKSSMVAEIYGVSPKTIRDIWNRKTWTQVTRHLWTPEEADDHALEQAHAKLPREEREALKDEMKKRRGRPPGSKDSRPRRRKVKENDENGILNYIAEDHIAPPAPLAYVAPMRMPGSSELLARGDDDWPEDVQNAEPSLHFDNEPKVSSPMANPGAEPRIFNGDVEPGLGHADIELHCPEPGCPDLPLYPSVCPGTTYADVSSLSHQEECQEENQLRPHMLMGPVGDLDFLEYMSQYNAFKTRGNTQKPALMPTPNNDSGPGIGSSGPVEEEVHTGDCYQHFLTAFSKSSSADSAHEAAGSSKDTTLFSTSSSQEFNWFPGGHDEAIFQTPVLKHLASPQVAPMLGVKPTSMTRRNSTVKPEGGSRPQQLKHNSRIFESPPPEDHSAVFNDWIFAPVGAEPTSPSFEDMMACSSGAWYN